VHRRAWVKVIVSGWERDKKMNGLTQILLIAAMVFTAGMAQAATISEAAVKAEIKKIVIEQNKRYTDATIEPEIATLPFSSIDVPEGKITYVVQSNFDKFVKRDIKRIAMYVNGKQVRKFVVTVNALAYKDVLVASKNIDREQVLSEGNTVSKRMEVSQNLDYVVTKEMLEKEMVAKKWFRESEIIDKRFLKMVPDVARNSTVQAYFNSNGILISISATALSEGMTGDYIDLENRAYNRKYRGKIIGVNKVLIGI
jgi:flagella basal body P-ring formation protein FlgA